MAQLKPVNTSLCLEKVCEANYQKLFKLIPDLRSFENSAVGLTPDQPTLYLSILERKPYTLTIELSHRFRHHLTESMTPAVTIRVYLDARLAEVIHDSDRPPVDKVYQNPANALEIQDYKWRLNYFLQKWLDHCLQGNYRFSIERCAA
ncbi:MAG: DUF1249 domain-containing protein [Methylomonas sp.]|nr:DUF1249 domain-containing protein [Methylomonas sp.]PPD21201.1 MAG: hypothetical protein CTY23_06095 [Methylomonas sp.]PPD27692.1 MAG: hypothetical protein CTY22_01355 [Methylomonas sp.]PPD38888.1 MAG: hypothetical protein CTY17_08760 [Methylomonas sp.]PPD39677.1 MAG: hypothetical protein CTY21_01350 [Methylomonas sp.]